MQKSIRDIVETIFIDQLPTWHQNRLPSSHVSAMRHNLK